MTQEKGKLVRGLTLITVFTLITGAMVGMAWATIIDKLFDYAGPAVILSGIIAAFFSVLIGLCYAELCAAMPYAGGEYHYTKRAMGGFASFVTGWFLIIAYSSMMPFEVIIFSKVASSLMPESWVESGYNLWGYTLPPVAMIITGIIVALFFGAVNYTGIRISAIAQLIFTVLLFLGIAVYVVGSVPYVNLNMFSDTFFDKGAGGMLMMVPIAMLAFMGFDIVPQAAEEIKSPIRKVVFLIPLSVLFVLIFYTGVFFISSSVVPYTDVVAYGAAKVEVPILPIAEMTLGPTLSKVIIVAGLMGLITTLNAFMIGSSRLMMGMANDGVLPRVLGKVHPKFGTPHVGIVVLTIFGILGSFFPFLLALMKVGSSAILVAFIMVCLSLIILRVKEPKMERPYKVPMYLFVAVLALIGSIAAELISIYVLIEDKELVGSVLFFGLAAVGLIYYFAVARKRDLDVTVKK
ncbi:MAG: amino acid permease [Deltaproteobacteria bacterium]|uniref:Amino acid permease n=1 Tax=Candidatus Zymogenus saltonus TaxID=2844893 RepID=A0A9D8PPE0_9DELT|nr:amino acid permease [Candidatus Zymogenus saltonus]